MRNLSKRYYVSMSTSQRRAEEYNSGAPRQRNSKVNIVSC